MTDAQRTDQQGLKDRDLQRYYEELLTMYAGQGWVYMTEDLTKLLDAANTLDGIDTMEQLNFRKGQVDILKKIIAQPPVARAAYDMLLADEQ